MALLDYPAHGRTTKGGEMGVTIKEAIERIERHNIIHDGSERHAVYITEALNMAIEALKKKEPQKAENIVGTAVSAMGKCPSCGAQLNTSFLSWQTETKFCYNCGQAVKWNDTETSC